MDTWIIIYGFLEDRASKKGKGSIVFEDGASVQDKSGQRGLVFFKD